MKAIIFPEKGRAELAEIETPQLQRGHVLVKTLYTGLTNGSERHVLSGGPYCSGFPAMVGYQTVGRVVEVGAGVYEFEEGDYVFTNDWGHKEYSAPPPDHVLKLPPGVVLSDAALFGVAACSLHGCARVDVRATERVLVFGLGPIGNTAAQICRAMGAFVVGVDIVSDRVTLAEQYACDLAYHGISPKIHEQLVEHGPYDVVVETTGVDGVIARSIEEVVNRGRILALAGRIEMKYSNTRAQEKELAFVHCTHFWKLDVYHVLRYYLQRKLRVAPLITHKVPVERMAEVYQTLLETPQNLMGVVFSWAEEEPVGGDWLRERFRD